MSFSEGLMRGAQFGMSLADAQRRKERQPIEDAQRDETYRLNQTLRSMQIDDLVDKRRRTELMRNVSMARFELENLGTTGKWDERNFARAMSRVRDADLNQGGPDGARKSINRVLPTPDGSGFMVDLKVDTADGKTYYAPLTKNRSTDPKDGVAVFGWDNVMQDLSAREAMLRRLDQLAVAYGDSNALRSNLEKLKHQQSLGLEKQKHGYRMAELGERAKLAKSVTKGSRSKEQWFYEVYTGALGMQPREAMARIEKMVQTAKVNPTQAAAVKQRLVADMRKGMAFLDPGEPGYLSDEEIESRADEILAGAMEQYSPQSDLVGDFPVGGEGTRPAIGAKARAKTPAGGGYDPGAFGPVTDAPRAMESPRPSGAIGQPGGAPAKQPVITLPPQALDALKQAGGKTVRFKNGQAWRLGPDGNPVQVQ